MALEPLGQWYCDQCGGLIEKPEEGSLVWLDDVSDGTGENHSFKILHKPYKSPSYPGRQMGCFPDGRSRDLPLNSMSGVRGLSVMLAMWDRGRVLDPDDTYRDKVRDAREWVEISKRLFVPYYEQARTYFDQARGDGYLLLEGQTYLEEDVLIRMIEHYAGEDLGDAHDKALARRCGET